MTQSLEHDFAYQFSNKSFEIFECLELSKSRKTMLLKQNNAFYNYQFEFRNSHSMIHALIDITK